MFVVMCQPPQRFGQIMAYVPMQVMSLLSLRSDVEFGARGNGTCRRNGARLRFTQRRSQVTSGPVLVPREATCRPRLRQLHLTAIPAGGARPQRSLPGVTGTTWRSLSCTSARRIQAMPGRCPRTCATRLSTPVPGTKASGRIWRSLRDTPRRSNCRRWSDRFDDSTEKAYTGWPDRLFLIDRQGRLASEQAGPIWLQAGGSSKRCFDRTWAICRSRTPGDSFPP